MHQTQLTASKFKVVTDSESDALPMINPGYQGTTGVEETTARLVADATFVFSLVAQMIAWIMIMMTGFAVHAATRTHIMYDFGVYFAAPLGIAALLTSIHWRVIRYDSGVVSRGVAACAVPTVMVLGTNAIVMTVGIHNYLIHSGVSGIF